MNNEPQKCITVFCGEHYGNDQKKYQKLAYNIGFALAKNGFIIATGGGPGQMSDVNHGAKDAGGKVISVQLDVRDRIQSPYFTEKFLFKDLKERQEKLINLASGLVVLPGGIGTVFEAFEILTRKRINTYPINNPVVFVDLLYYSPIRDFITKACETGFIKVPLEKFAAFVDTPKEVVSLLKKLMQ
jgi:uncharacterized protein (TIGR00730 family)